jgi:kexin
MNMRLVLAILLSAGLAACGGGSGGGAATGTAPGAPTGVTAVAKDGYVLLDANPPTGTITGFNVYWSTASGVSKSSPDKFAVGYATPQAHTGLTNNTTYYYVVTAVNAAGEGPASAQVSATPVQAAVVIDPLFVDQWHLQNTGQPGADSNLTPGTNGIDLNVLTAWNAGHLGQGVRIAIVDDGIEIAHEDLASNMGANIWSRNYVAGAPSSTDPSYNTDAAFNSYGHGTSCAGIAAARFGNGLGGSGVAPFATLVGYNYTADQRTSNEADAMTHNAVDVSVSSNSWGAPDGRGKLDVSDAGWSSAIDTGLQTGRNGLGTVYTWAAGNGRQVNVTPSGGGAAVTTLVDNSNYDGQANYRGVMAVAAINDHGTQAHYSESGANVWVSAPGGEWCVYQYPGVSVHAITTVDRTGVPGENSGSVPGDYTNGTYTKCMNGTSSATPAVAGVVALVLEANPTLTWRDVRAILAQSARMNDAADIAGWHNTGGSVVYHFNHKYGYGLVDAGAAVSLAGNWPKFPAQKIYTSTATPTNVPVAIPDNTGAAVTSTITVPTNASGISSIEFVDVTFDATGHTYFGDLQVTLTSPSGSTSVLAETHLCVATDKTTGIHTQASCGTYTVPWRFGDAGHLGEPADGVWTLKVYDLGPGDIGTLKNWGLKFYGH